MLLLATSDDPDRRDPSDPETANPEASSAQPADEARAPLQPLTEAGPDAPGAEVPPHETDASTQSETDDDAEPVPPASASPPPPEALASATPDDATAPPAEPEPVPPTTETERPVSAAPDQAKRSPLQRAALALLIIAAAALIGYVLSRPSGRSAEADALVRSIEAAGRLQLRLETDTPAEARSYIRDEFGWRVGVPVFEAIPLRGVAIAQTAPAVEVPVFLYADAEGRNVAVFAYSYALLDQVPDRLRLTADDYDALDDGIPFVRRADGNEVVVWRDRDDIYVAVTDLPPEALTDGFAMAR